MARPAIRRLALVPLVPLMCMQAACSTPEPPAPSNQETTRYFAGTPEEHAVLLRACLEENGIETALPPNSPKDGFAITSESMADENFERIMADCREEIGSPRMAGLSQDELQIRYDARVTQWECLVAEDFTAGEPISFDSFVEDYNRSGQIYLWEPTENLEPKIVNGVPQGPTDICPRVAAW